MTCRPQRAWIRWQDCIKNIASAIVSFLLKWDLSIVQSHSVQKCTGQICFSPEALATILWNGLVSIWALMVSLARWEMTARQHRGGLARADITNGERRYLKDRNHFAFEVFKCKQSLFNPTQSTSGTIDVQGILHNLDLTFILWNICWD